MKLSHNMTRVLTALAKPDGTPGCEPTRQERYEEPGGVSFTVELYLFPNSKGGVIVEHIPHHNEIRISEYSTACGRWGAIEAYSAVIEFHEGTERRERV